MLPDSPTTHRLPDDERLGDFAQVLTHRIRNLLAGIEGFTDLLTDTLGSREQRELALRILESTARIAQRCAAFDLTKDLGYRFPDFPVPEVHTSQSYLEHLCW